jgi:hypothetical protein
MSSNGLEKVSTVVGWSALVIEPKNDGDEKGIPDEKPVDEQSYVCSVRFKIRGGQEGC